MQEYKDGTFGEIKEGSKLLRELADSPEELEKTAAVHFGTRAQLEEQKMTSGNAKRIMNKLEQLERKINRVIAHLGIETPGEILVVE